MPKRIVIFLDGTWNAKFGGIGVKESWTNVARLRRAVAASGSPDQATAYFPGVGRGWSASIGPVWRGVHTMTRGRLDPIFGGTSGWGLSRQIQEAYAVLVSAYEPGDAIFVFGFSRGAFAARSLVGLIKHAGLLRRSHESLIRSATSAYHRLLRSSKHRLFLESLRPFTHTGVRVRFVGAWDTVSAMGAPIWGGSFSLNPLPLKARYHDIDAWDIVDIACHAMAIDEQRTTFAAVPMLPSESAPTYLTQVWFRGVHADVGGGYSDAALADLSLRWMAKEAGAAGLATASRMIPDAPKRHELTVHDSIGPYASTGIWPRWFPVVSSADDPDYDPSRGHLHESVNAIASEGTAEGNWLVDLLPGEETLPIPIYANTFWNNTRVIVRKGVSYRVRVEGCWHVDGASSGPEGRPAAIRLSRVGEFLRVPSAARGELIAITNAPPTEPPPKGRLWHALRYLFGKQPRYLVSMIERWSTLEADPTGGKLLRGQRTGVLHLFANTSPGRQRNSRGVLTITVARMP